MFFIKWKPWDWSDGFSDPGFPVNYKKLLAEGKVCKGGQHGNLLELSGHITAQHPLAQAKKCEYRGRIKVIKSVEAYNTEWPKFQPNKFQISIEIYLSPSYSMFSIIYWK